MMRSWVHSQIFLVVILLLKGEFSDSNDQCSVHFSVAPAISY